VLLLLDQGRAIEALRVVRPPRDQQMRGLQSLRTPVGEIE